MEASVKKALAAATYVPYAQKVEALDVFDLFAAEQAMYTPALPKGRILVCLSSLQETNEYVAFLQSNNYFAEGFSNAEQTLNRAVEIVPDLILVAMESCVVGRLSLFYQLQEVVQWPAHSNNTNGPATIMLVSPSPPDPDIWFPRIDYGPDMYLTRGRNKRELLHFVKRLIGH